jgi:hypothetical protein
MDKQLMSSDYKMEETMYSQNLTKYIGLGILFLGLLRIGGLSIETVFIIGFSISAFLFTFADYFEFEFVKSKKRLNIVYNVLLEALRYSAVFAFLILPFELKQISLPKEIIDKINDVTLLLGLGIAIYYLGRRQDNEREQLIKLLIDADETMHKYKEEMQEIKREIDILKKERDKLRA